MFSISPFKSLLFISILTFVFCGNSFSQAKKTANHNPIFKGWYADPEARIFGKEYWVYPTYSAKYDEQVFLDAFSSTDLVTWKKHGHILDTANVQWAKRAVWAPSITEKNGKYYLFFGANDIQSDGQYG